MGVVAIPRAYLGHTIEDSEIKRVLRELNPDFHFDLGGKHGIWHPRQDQLQGVFFRGQHVCSMDRGMVPEFPLWSLRKERVRVPETDVGTAEEFPSFEVKYDAQGNAHRTGFVFVSKEVKDQILFVGWRHTFRRILQKNKPGVTKAALEREFRIDLTPRLIDEPEVEEADSVRAVDRL